MLWALRQRPAWALGKALSSERLFPPHWIAPLFGKGVSLMLVLSRRLHERIQFPGLNITVQVVAIKPGIVRIGIEAPPDVKVFRAEILPQPPAPAATVATL